MIYTHEGIRYYNSSLNMLENFSATIVIFTLFFSLLGLIECALCSKQIIALARCAILVLPSQHFKKRIVLFIVYTEERIKQEFRN